MLIHKIIIFSLIAVNFIADKAYSAGEAGDVLKDTGKQAVIGGAVGTAGSYAGKAAIEKAAPGFTEKIGTFFDTPPGILTVSGIATVYSGMLYNAAAIQEEESNANVKKIDRLIATYKDSWLNYCPNGREDLKEPNCYCYSEDGKQNPNRTKSDICTALWAKNSLKLSAIAGDYSGVSKFVDPVGCLTINGQFDENCKCKKFVDAKGTNACAKSTTVTIPGGSFGSSFADNTGLKEILKFNANAGNGNPRFDLLSTGQLSGKAISSSMLLDRLLNQFSAGQGKAKVIYADENNIAKLSKSVFGEKAIAAAMGSNQSSLSMSASAPKDKNTSDLLKSAAAKAGIDLSGSGRGLQNKKAEAKEGLNFNLMGDNNASGASQTQDFPETEKNYKIKGDISKASDTSIFEIISNRYIQSGLKRLFEQ